MAFGINREELRAWKQQVQNGEIAFLTHYWLDDRFPDCHTVTKVGCVDIEKLIAWGNKHGLEESWIHKRDQFPHFDLVGDLQINILKKENKFDHVQRFE